MVWWDKMRGNSSGRHKTHFRMRSACNTINSWRDSCVIVACRNSDKWTHSLVSINASFQNANSRINIPYTVSSSFTLSTKCTDSSTIATLFSVGGSNYPVVPRPSSRHARSPKRGAGTRGDLHEGTSRRDLSHEQFTRSGLSNKSQRLVPKIQTSLNSWDLSQGPKFGPCD